MEKINREMGRPLALDGCHLMGGHNNQPKVGVDSGRDIGEEARLGRNMRGGCLFVPSGKLNKIKIKKSWP